MKKVKSVFTYFIFCVEIFYFFVILVIGIYVGRNILKMRLFIIRHGDPDYSIDNLTPRGKIEAELLSERLVRENLTHIYSSPLGRARATAEPTAVKTGIEPVVYDWLREFPAGIKMEDRPEGTCPWEMRSENFNNIPELYDREKWKTVSPFAESKCPEVFENITRQLDLLLEKHGYKRNGFLYDKTGEKDDTIAFFCHFGLGMALYSHLCSISLPLLWVSGLLMPSSVTELRTERCRSDKSKAHARCILRGDISHLYGADIGFYNIR